MAAALAAATTKTRLCCFEADKDTSIRVISMSADYSVHHSEKQTVVKRALSFLLIIPSAVIGLVLVELLCRLFVPSMLNPQSNGIVFFDGRDAIFRNVGDIFTYLPHNEVRNFTVFYSNDGFEVEYDYHFMTNNFGLVQDSDLVPDRDSLLLLGDSFTEGQGAKPWFRLVRPEIEKLGYQPVNGGMLATGFVHWLKLGEYLAANHIRIRKLVVLFISDDYTRMVWNFMPDDFRCLSALAECQFEKSMFYRLPPPDELSWWITKIRASRTTPMNRTPTTTLKGWMVSHLVTLLPASFSLYKRFYMNRTGPQSSTAIAELIGLVGSENVIFIHLPKREEIANGPDELGSQARRAIQQAGGRLFDGFKLCGLTTTDYYPNDHHPNSGGYAKIAACVNSVIRETVAKGS